MFAAIARIRGRIAFLPKLNNALILASLKSSIISRPGLTSRRRAFSDRPIALPTSAFLVVNSHVLTTDILFLFFPVLLSVIPFRRLLLSLSLLLPWWHPTRLARGSNSRGYPGTSPRHGQLRRLLSYLRLCSGWDFPGRPCPGRRNRFPDRDSPGP